MNGSSTIEITLAVGPHYDGWRLDHFIKARIPRLSRSRIQQMIRAQEGAALRPSSRVRGGQEIRLLRPAPREPDVPRHYEVVYRDEALLVIDKPAGLPVHATARYHRNTLTALLREQFGPTRAPNLVHRIDRETSGLLLLAWDQTVEVAIKRQLSQRRVHKTYLAIVNGDPGPEGTIDLPIGDDQHSGIRIRRAVTDDGLPAKTRFRRREQRQGFSLLEVFPETGRQHQIRVHLAAIGCSIVGDKLYGPDPSCMLEYLATGWSAELEQQLLLPRQALHAAAISFVHPKTAAPMTLTCALSADLQVFWDNLERAESARCAPAASLPSRPTTSPAQR